MTLDAGGVWSEQDTSPGAIEDALRKLLQEQFARDEACAPARVINLVVVVDREWRGEILNRLEGMGQYHPSRTILCAVESGRTTIDASLALTTEGEAGHKAGEIALTRERILLDLGPLHLDNLATIVDPLVVSDIATVAWAPHGHQEAIDALLHLTQVVLVDSVNEPDPGAAIHRADALAGEAYIVDLAWLRSTPWRERVAATFDPSPWREELRRISSVTVRHHTESTVAGLLFLGWLASRLDWQPESLISAGGSLKGRARARRQDVDLELVPDGRMSVPGLAGIKIATSSGMSISLDRGPGGLSARREDRKGRESSWTVLGASRGEAGILGEGIRQALLRDRAYARALDRVGAMVG
jgi:glucose-6-phosphate dehydrogenase assembly protein OpcA